MNLKFVQIVAGEAGSLYGLTQYGSVHALRWREVITEKEVYNEYGGREKATRREYFWQALPMQEAQ